MTRLTALRTKVARLTGMQDATIFRSFRDDSQNYRQVDGCFCDGFGDGTLLAFAIP